MSLKRKVSISIITILIIMLLFPILALKLGGAMAGMALCFILFFAIDPLTVLCLSIMAGTDIRHLFWIPPVSAAAFPVCFSLAVGEWVTDLFVYAGVYFAIGMIAMISSCLGKHYLSKRKNQADPR